MQDSLHKILTQTEAETIRGKILELESQIIDVEGSFVGDSDKCPLTHRFSDGIYVREIKIPKGMLIVGKIHKHDHPNFLMEGEVCVITETEGEEYLAAPLSMISKKGTKRALYAITDLTWVTVHNNPTNTQDLEELEKLVIAPSYEMYQKHIESDRGIMKRIKKGLIKRLSK